MRTQLITILLLFGLLSGCGLISPLPSESPPPSSPVVSPPAPSPADTVLVPDNLSAGDPYASELGNRGYDVQRYTLRLILDPQESTIDGQALIEARSTQDRLKQISLDLVGLEVRGILLGDAPVEFWRQEGKLFIDLPQALSTGTAFSLTVSYGGAPAQQPSHYIPFVSHLGLFFTPPDILFVAAEPDGARYWYPVNDHPRDKATYRFELTVPAKLVGVANGQLMAVQKDLPRAFPDGRAGDLYSWEHNYPVASAFVTVAAGPYELEEGKSPAGLFLRNYVLPDQRAAFDQAATHVGEALDWMSERFGPYPFEAFGYVTVSGLGASLETQTMVLISQEGGLNETTMVHEMAHMWFGDWVSLDTWGQMWRSEGFATYVSVLWSTRDHPDQLDQTMAEMAQQFQDHPSNYPLDNPPPAQLFGRDSYLKGAAFLHALHKEMGDDAFFQGVRTYISRYGGSTATDADFRAVMEEAAGRSLEGVFSEWFK